MFDSEEILSRMNDGQKVNYDKVLQRMIQNWAENEVRPRILLHSCCAPCSTYSLEYLTRFADITVYFANSNIHPRSEYERRKLVQEQFIEAFNAKNQTEVAFLSAPYEPNVFIREVKKLQLENEPEGGKRCSACFHMRLDIVARKAEELGYDYFGSALTLSPKKNSQVINEIGIEIQQFFQTRYLPSDFKKNNGYQRSIELCKAYDVYRQCYCGCIFVAAKQNIDFKAVNKEATAFLKKNADRHS